MMTRTIWQYEKLKFKLKNNTKTKKNLSLKNEKVLKGKLFRKPDSKIKQRMLSV
jgi:hypothetical protein